MDRRKAAGLAGVLAGGLSAAGLIEGFLIEPFRVALVELEVTLPRLPWELDGIEVLQLSDLHFRQRPRLQECLLALASRSAPDLVVITGDLIDREADMDACLAFLAELHDRTRAPVVTVPGNWEHRIFPTKAGIAKWYERVRGEGRATVLVNESVCLRRGDGSLWLVGTDDPYFGHADLAASFDGVPDDACALVLTHAPEAFEELARWKQARLVLAGHTHGGQVCLPLVGPLRVPSRYGTRFAHGLFRIGGALFYVNEGIGTSHMPVRFLCPPELTSITIRSETP
jgi:predicted MPP superfamily phosphohydrolase